MANDGGTGGGQGATTATGGGTSAQPGQGTGAGSYVVPTNNGGATAAATPDSRREEARESFASVHVSKLVRRFGTLELALESLAGELFDIREERRQAPAPPPAGSMVLVGDDVKAWQGYQALGLPPDKVKEGLAERDTLKAKDSAAAQGTTNQQATQALGWKDATALGELLTAKGLQLDMRDVQVVEAGKTPTTKRMPFVRKASDGTAAWEPLADVVNTHHKAWLPALTTDAQGGGGTSTTAPGSNGTQGGAGGTRKGQPNQQQATGRSGAQGGTATTAVVVSSGQQTAQESDTQGGGSLVQRRLDRNRQAANAPSALRPAKPAT